MNEIRWSDKNRDKKAGTGLLKKGRHGGLPLLGSVITMGHGLDGCFHLGFVHTGKAEDGRWLMILDEAVVGIVPGDAFVVTACSKFFKCAFRVIPPAKEIGAHFGFCEGEGIGHVGVE